MANKPTPKNRYLLKLAAAFGGPAGLAAALGVKAPTVYQWISGVRHVPPVQCVAIECLTRGKWTAERLGPTQQWLRVQDKDWPHPDGRPVLDLVKKCEQEA